MEFWWIILGCDLLIPVIMVISGLIMAKRCPKEINSFLGYRTARSMKNMDTWKFAHECCGKIWWKLGIVIFVLSFLAHLPFYKSSEEIIGNVSLVVSVIQIIVLIVSTFFVENLLKKNFDEDGIRR